MYVNLSSFCAEYMFFLVKRIILMMSTLLSLFQALENYEEVKPWSSLLSPFLTF